MENVIFTLYPERISHFPCKDLPLDLNEDSEALRCQHICYCRETCVSLLACENMLNGTYRFVLRFNMCPLPLHGGSYLQISSKNLF